MPDQVPDGMVLAAWQGAGPVYITATRTILNPGDTHIIPAGEAEESTHWAPVRPTKPRTRDTAAKPIQEADNKEEAA